MRVKGSKSETVNRIYWEHCNGFDAWISIDIIQYNLVSIDVGNCTTRNRRDYIVPHCTYPTKSDILCWINSILEEL